MARNSAELASGAGCARRTGTAIGNRHRCSHSRMEDPVIAPGAAISDTNHVTEGGVDQPWFGKGIEAALKAPTAVNQQKFQFCLKDGCPYIRVKGLGAYTKADLGIVAYHFEVASGKKVQH